MIAFVELLSTRLILVALCLYFFNSCSVKKDDSFENLSNDETLNIQSVDNSNDRDGDGLSNDLEVKVGRDPDLGHFPEFTIRNFKETTFIFNGIDTDRKSVEHGYKTLNPNYSIDYRPLKNSIARYSYQRYAGNNLDVPRFDLETLNVFKLSNFNDQEKRRISKFIVNKVDTNIENISIRLQSEFSLHVNNVAGIEKISDINVSLGFIGENDEFTSVGSSFYLNDIDGVRLFFKPLGDLREIYSSSSVLINVNNIELDDYRIIFDEKKNLAIKINNYSVDTIDGGSFTYNAQVANALEKTSIYAISGEESDSIFFSPKKESIKLLLERLYGTVAADSEGAIVSVGEKVSNTDYPILLDNYNADHLGQSSWHLFSKDSKISDTPDFGEVVMLGFLKNHELAQAGNQRNLKNSFSRLAIGDIVKTCESDQVCIARMQQEYIYSLKKGLTLKNFKIGETIEIKLSGTKFTPIASSLETRSVEYVSYKEDCTCDYGDCYSTPPDRIVCYEVKEVTKCPYKWNSRKYAKSIIKDPSHSFIGKYINLIPEKSLLPMTFNDKAFFNLYLPEKLDSETLLITFKITDDFIDKYGKELYLEFPDVKVPSFNHGFQGFVNRSCNNRSLDIENNITLEAGDVFRDYNINVNRIFKN